MKSRNPNLCIARALLAAAAAVFALVLPAESAAAASGGAAPLAVVRNATNRILAIVTDATLRGEKHRAVREEKMMRVVDSVFDWPAISRRSLGRHWPRNDPEAQRKFIRLFRKLLRKTYLVKVEGYSGEKVRYDGQKLDGDYARVMVSITTKDGTEIPVVYRMRRRQGAWRVYDVVIEGVSLVNNYRSQFNSILLHSSFDELLARLRRKVEK